MSEQYREGLKKTCDELLAEVFGLNSNISNNDPEISRKISFHLNQTRINTNFRFNLEKNSVSKNISAQEFARLSPFAYIVNH